MTFLEICQKVREKVAVSGQGPSTVVAQTGSMLRVINCVVEAWREIQSSSDSWKFMQKSGTLSLVLGTQLYSLATLVAANPLYGEVMTDTLKFIDGNRLEFVDYDRWEADSIDIGTLTGKPTQWTQDADLALLFYPIPDADFSLRFRYSRAPQVLAANADIPVCPAAFHMAIVYRAAILYAELDEAQELLRGFLPEYQTWMAKMEADQLPSVGFSPSRYRSVR